MPLKALQLLIPWWGGTFPWFLFCVKTADEFPRGHLKPQEMPQESACVHPSLPFLHSDEVKSHLSVGKGFFIQVAAVAPYECWHVVPWNRAKNLNKSQSEASHCMKKIGVFQVLRM